MTKAKEVSNETHSAPVQGKTGRDHLQKYLDQGPAALGDQVRYLLAVSQVVGKKSAPSPPYPSKTLTVRQSRYYALAKMADLLEEEQLLQLVQNVSQIGDATVRLPLLASFAHHLPVDVLRVIVRDIWKQVGAIVDPVAQAETLFDLVPLIERVEGELTAPSALIQVLREARQIKNTEGRIRALIALRPYLPQEIVRDYFEEALQHILESRNDTLTSKALMTLAHHLPASLTALAVRVSDSIRKPTEKARALTALSSASNLAAIAQVQEKTLDTISQIEAEDDRAEALILFAPNLDYASQTGEYSAILQKAIAITLGITRRSLRAKILVALSPHLTPDLQGEALAAVHVLENERERADLLAKLAPSMPANMIIASMAVAHSIRERDARVHALATLAKYAPEYARQQTTMDALASASNLPNLYERVRSLVQLLEVLPEDLRLQALKNALSAARQISNDAARSRAIALLGGELTPEMIPAGLELAREIGHAEHRLKALLGIVAAMSDAEAIIPELFNCAAQMPLVYKQARAYIVLSAYLPVRHLDRLIELAADLDDPVDEVHVLIAVIQHQPPEVRPPLVEKAWRRIQRIGDGYDRASAVTALAPFLPDEIKQKLPELIYETVRTIVDDYDKASAIALLAPQLAASGMEVFVTLPDRYEVLQRGFDTVLSILQQNLRTQLLARGAQLWVVGEPPRKTYLLWRSLVHRMVDMPVADVLLCLTALMPLIQDFAGKERAKNIAQILGIR